MANHKKYNLDELFKFVQQYSVDYGRPPSVRDILLSYRQRNGVAFTSTSIIRYNLLLLEKEGRIEVTPRISRGIRILRQEHAAA